MAIVGIGLDVVELDRIERIWRRFRDSFARRILTGAEYASLPAQAVPYLASRFAAKEAAVKALGTGFSRGITIVHVEVSVLPSGQPVLKFLDKALEAARNMNVRTAHLSLTHGRNLAAAVVVLEK